ncbi:hypothetical protein DVA86_08090 [Streptomyces armeniacus]|uniref:DUF308 domain-containing protein n=1 Tax=Streptomyces armeniacus TaxID=83291 RepID=A0A345XLU4_9ACTN|nr:hypothetical protein [Streptomyces armeniacus]AXK32610.1 hypothetical protein DVA86_08090 [Streptomyces armeniacus]
MTGRNADSGKGGDEPEPVLPPDEEAAWAEIVAAYGEVPDVGQADAGLRTDDDGPGGSGDAREDDGADAPDEAREDDGDGGHGDGHDRREPDGDTLTRPADDDRDRDPEDAGDPPVRSVTVYAAGTGPRDWDAAEEDEDEGHFVPPEPPPLPETDPTTRFAWFAVLGGPLLLLAAVLFRLDMTWWIITLGVGGFLGGFGTLVARMRDDSDDDDFEDPGRGAVV